MQVRKFQAKNMREALAAVKDALGPDAIIVATRPLPAKGLFGRPMLEVTAALDEPTLSAAPQGPCNVLPTQVETDALDPLRRELRAIRSEIRQRPVTEQRVASEPWAARVLRSADVNPRMARLLARDVQQRLRAEDIQHAADVDEQKRLLTSVVQSLLKCNPSITRGEGQRRIALVGPTGVGKTTTIAKIAAIAAMVERRSVALISLDTFRVGAFEQLQHYARLMRVPVYPTPDRPHFVDTLKRCHDADLVLIDTAGRGSTDGLDYMKELADCFAGNDVMPLMTIGAATRSNELEALLDVYRGIEPVGTVFTKLDEAMVLGAILNAQQAYKVPMTYITMGQRVPEDIALANPASLASRIVASGVKALAEQSPASGTTSNEEDRHARHQ